MKSTHFATARTTIAAFASLALTGGLASAATVVGTDAIWPTTTGAQTIDVFTNDPTPSSRSLNGTRELRQTFQVASDFTVGEIYLSFQGYNNVAFTISFFEVANIEAGTWSAGTQVGSIITVDPFGSTFAGDGNLAISLSGAEQFLLTQRNTGSTGYGMELALVDTTQTVAGWRHMLGLGDQAPGRFYNESGAGQPVERDMGLALVAVPEPSAALLGGLSCLFLLRRRR